MEPQHKQEDTRANRLTRHGHVKFKFVRITSFETKEHAGAFASMLRLLCGVEGVIQTAGLGTETPVTRHVTVLI